VLIVGAELYDVGAMDANFERSVGPTLSDNMLVAGHACDVVISYQ